MKIGIIGAGNIGGALTRLWRKIGHEVSVANSRGPETLGDLAAETGAKPVSVTQAVQGADVVIITIPQKAVQDLPKGLFENVPKDVVVVDTNNYYPARDGSIQAIEQGTLESVWVSQQIGRPVIKAFNNIYAQHLHEKGTPKGTRGRLALPVSGDDAAGKATVLLLIDELGFEPIDAGSLEDSWRQQPGTPVYTQDLDASRTKVALAEADRSKIGEYRNAANEAVKKYFTS